MVLNIVYFHPYLGKIPILTNIFQMGWNHQPVMFFFVYSPFLVDIAKPRKHLGEYTEDDPVLEICGRNSQSNLASAVSYH